MISTIAIREIKSLIREKILWIASIIIVSLLITALCTSLINVRQLNKERVYAQELSREGWLLQPAKNPHSAAHFGNFAFRIKSPLSIFDNGLDAYTGTYLFLEPHKQNGDKFSQAEESTSLLRFGEFTPAMVLQTLLPLLIIFVCFSSISGEKEANTLKLLITQGGNIQKLIVGKILGNWLAFSFLLLFFFVCSFAATILVSKHNIEVLRFLLVFICYLLYTAIWICISVLVSAYSQTSRSALLKLLGIWMLAVIIIPKVSANIGNVVYKTPSQFEMATLINKDINEGIDGHDPKDKRRAALLEKTLKKYNVTKIEDLPVNFDAIAMIESEDYTTNVFRKRKAEIDRVFLKQNSISEWFSFLNPVQALQQTSMALCGTDYHHFRDFQDQAEVYRLYFVNEMNEHMSEHTKSGDWKTTFGKELYETIKPFVYKPPTLSFSIKNQAISFIALLFGALVCIVLIFFTKRIKIQ